jgi:HlyD family secretion protein
MNRSPRSLVRPFAFVASAALVSVGAGSAAAGAQSPAIEWAVARPVASSEARASGRIVPAWSAEVGARVAGRITSWGSDARGRPLDVGSRVAAGAEIFRLDASVAEAREASAKAALKTTEARLADLRAGWRPERTAVLVAAVKEIDARLEELRRDEERYRRLVEQDRTVAPKKLEETRAQRVVAEAQRAAAAARVAEAEAGATKTELAVAEASVAEAAAAVRSAELDVKDAVVRAPFAGVVVRRAKALGDYVNHAPFTAVVEIVSDADLEAELRLPESLLNDVAAGSAQVVIESPLLDEPLKAVVDRVGVVDPREGVFSFRVIVPPERRGRLVPGAFVQAKIATSRAAGAVTVPRAALFEEADGAFVFVAKDGALRRAPVEIAERLTDSAVLRKGVAPGERVAVGPRAALKEGASAGPPPKSE